MTMQHCCATRFNGTKSNPLIDVHRKFNKPSHNKLCWIQDLLTNVLPIIIQVNT